MTCPSCGFATSEAAKFCKKCGSALSRVCAGCGQTNDFDANFCAECGANLTQGAHTPAPEVTPQAGGHVASVSPAERRLITVMFCDMVGSSALSTQLDPEENRDVVGAFLSCCTIEIKHLDGMVAQYQGDGILAYFGYPTAHEDDAERAVRAGLAILDAVRTLRPAPNVVVQARVGIASGVVVVGDLVREGMIQENAAIGETTNLAARLQSLAESNSIVIGPETHRLVGALFEYRDLGLHTLKGFDGPLHVRQVIRPSKIENRFEVRRAAVGSPLLGRDEELEMLWRRWELAKRGEGRVVLLTGEAGIGKSRLTRALQARLSSEPHTPLIFHCSPYHQDSALYSITAQLIRAAGIEREESTEERLTKLETLLRRSSDNLAEDMPLFAALLSIPVGDRYPPLNLAPQRLKERTLHALLDQLKRLSANRPVLIVFEDLHWIDPTSLELLSLVVEEASGLRLLVLATCRPGFTPPWPAHRHVSSIGLSRLDRAEGEALVTGVTGGKRLPPELLEQIIARTDGIPLFIEELTKTVLESGLLRETGERYELSGSLPGLTIPSTLHASLLARLDRLGAAKDVVQIGAAIGREFSYALLAAAAGLPEKHLRDALAQLVDAELIFQRGVPPDATYSFKHVLLQDAAYGSLVRTRRQHLHARIAEALVDRFPATVASLPAIAAHQFAEAGRTNEAIEYWRIAGQLASGRFALAEARRCFERVIGLLDTIPETPSSLEFGFETRLELRPILTQLGESRIALDRLSEADSLAQRLGDVARRGRVCAFMTHIHALLGDLDAALVTGTRALEVARRVGDRRLQQLTNTYLILSNHFRGDYERAVELAVENLAALPPGWQGERLWWHGPPIPVYDRSLLVRTLAELGRFEEAARHEADMLSLAQQIQRPFTTALANFSSAVPHLVQGDWTTARSLTESAIDVLRTNGIDILLPYAVANLAKVLAHLGEASEAEARLQEGESLLKHHTANNTVGQSGKAYYRLGCAALLIGKLEDSQRLADLAVSFSLSHFGFAADIQHLLGDIAAHSECFDVESAEAHYRQALALAEPLGMKPLVAHCHLGLGKLFRSTGSKQRASKYLALATTAYHEMNMRTWLLQAEMEVRELR